MDNDRRREALRVRFMADVEADASEVGGGPGCVLSSKVKVVGKKFVAWKL